MALLIAPGVMPELVTVTCPECGDADELCGCELCSDTKQLEICSSCYQVPGVVHGLEVCGCTTLLGSVAA